MKNIEKSIDKLFNNTKGDYIVTADYAETVNEQAPVHVEFDPKKKVKIVAKSLREATGLVVYLDKFGQRADIAHVNERDS